MLFGVDNNFLIDDQGFEQALSAQHEVIAAEVEILRLALVSAAEAGF